MDYTDSYVTGRSRFAIKFARFPKVFRPGTMVPDFELSDSDGKMHRLADFWSNWPLILEFGSAT